MADEPMPLNEGAQLLELLRRIRDERVLVYSEGPDHLATECKTQSGSGRLRVIKLLWRWQRRC